MVYVSAVTPEDISNILNLENGLVSAVTCLLLFLAKTYHDSLKSQIQYERSEKEKSQSAHLDTLNKHVDLQVKIMSLK